VLHAFLKKAMASMGMSASSWSGFEEDEAGPFPSIFQPPQIPKSGKREQGAQKWGLEEFDPFMPLVAKTPADIEILPRGSPYVGYQRHAPPSPELHFTEMECKGVRRFKLDTLTEEGEECESFPMELWVYVLSLCAEVRALAKLSSLASCFADAVRLPEVWRGQRVRVGPQAVELFAPKLNAWLPTWSGVSALLLPNSRQLLEEVSRQLPGFPVEVAWRFEPQHTGEGIEVKQNGAAVRRVADAELVALGGSPVTTPAGAPIYIEVRIDARRGPDVTGHDELNDMGIGFTACCPNDIEEIGAVAAEIPMSWVVDFASSFVLLTVNNNEVDKKYGVSSADLEEGNTVGLRSPRAGLIEVYINGKLRETFNLPAEECVPQGVPIYPLFDLYGKTEQISCTGAEEPVPPFPKVMCRGQRRRPVHLRDGSAHDEL
jgi:hypothetical protein